MSRCVSQETCDFLHPGLHCEDYAAMLVEEWRGVAQKVLEQHPEWMSRVEPRQ